MIIFKIDKVAYCAVLLTYTANSHLSLPNIYRQNIWLCLCMCIFIMSNIFSPSLATVALSQGSSFFMQTTL